jgi:hypothetical protein
MNFEHVPTHAWEMNETSPHQRVNQHGQKKYADDQQGLKRRLQGKGAKRFENYGYLMLDPHEKYANKGKLRGHTGQYPFEEMKVGDKHVHVDPNTEAPTEYEPHPFDEHPLFSKEGKNSAWERPESERSDADREKYAQAIENWQDSPHFNKWLDKQEELESQDPEAYAERGSKPSKLLEGVKQGQPKEENKAEEIKGAGDSKKSDLPVEKKPEVIKRVAKEPEPSSDDVISRLMAASKALKQNPNDPKLKEEYDAAHAMLKRKDAK